MRSKRGQVAVFIIIGVVIVGLVIGFLAFRDRLGITGLPAELQPVFSFYDQCLDDALQAGISLAGAQGGYIEPGSYTPGSDYAPFSSHLFFMGMQLPYWFGLESNGLIREQVPSESDIERQLASFIEEHITLCDFTAFRTQGFVVDVDDDPQVSVTLEDERMRAHVTHGLHASYGEQSASRATHDVDVSSAFGSLYHEAVQVYETQKENAYLDTYAADVLRLYAPVDGVEVQCSPEIWQTREVITGLQEALVANLAAVRYSGTPSDDDYFSIPEQREHAIRVLYNPEWPSAFEVSPADAELMIAEPVGNQEGLGVLGFCYVPYHFVYDMRFPVMMQLYEGDELFQFPLVVLVDNNLPRTASYTGPAAAPSAPDVCSFAEGSALISTYDTHLNPVEADVFYQCFDQRCPLGRTSLSDGTARLETAIPVCVNGYVIARAENFSEAQTLFSSNSESSVDLILEQEYPLEVRVFVDGVRTMDTSLVHFIRADNQSISALVPDQSGVTLAEGLYTVTVFVYGNSSIVIPGTTRQQCTEVARGGLAGFLGGTEERCFDITSPETRVDHALRGGGTSHDVYLLESELATGFLNVYVTGLPRPTTLEQLQINFELFESASVEVGFS